MKKNNRTINSTKNVVINLFIQMGQLIVNFIGRTAFIYFLGVEYLGINGLFTNILTFLSLTELGFGNAIIYSMYKPLADGDEDKLAALMNFYKKIYRVIAIIVLVLGISLLPFLQYIVSMKDLSISLNMIRIYYLLFLINSVVSYLFVYKTTIISADQKMYVIKKYTFIALCIENIVQIVVVILTHNYILYLIIQILYTLLSNMYGAHLAKKMYPFIEKKEELNKEEKNKIYSNVGSIFIYKVSGTILNNTDNILISIIVSTLAVGYYSNYTLLINALLGIITIVFNSVSASIGNLNTTATPQHKKTIFEELTLLCFWIMGISSVCLLNGLNDFVELWVGKEYVLSNYILLIIVLNYYIYGTLNPIWTFRDTTGIFKDAKNISIILAILNIVLSIILGKIYGMFGILLATAISRLLTTYWYQPYVLYKKIFNSKIKKYYFEQAKNFAILVIAYLITIPFVKLFKGVTIVNFVLKMGISVVLSTAVIILLTFKNENMKDLKNRFISILKMIKSKKHNA